MTTSLEPKLPGEVRRYRHDWSPFLGEDTIASEDTAAVGATLDNVEIEDGDQSVVLTVSGGTSGVNATITHTITTAAGDEETEVFVLPIGYDEPVTLSEAKAQCRMADDDSEDAFIDSLRTPARAYVERCSRYSWVAAAREESFGQWGDFLEIYRRPITSIDSISYTEESGAVVEVEKIDPAVVPEGFLAPLGRFPVRIYPAIDGDFPALGDGGAITVAYTTGSLAVTSEEYLMGKRAMLLLIGHWFEFREAAAAGIVSSEIALAVSSLLDDLRPVSAY